MIGLLTKGKVPEGIVYRPNNISTLEEKNITLFLTHVEKELNLYKLFEKHGNQVFQKFANFYVVLSGLAKVSQKIKRMHKDIPSFISREKETDASEYYGVDSNCQLVTNTINDQPEDLDIALLAQREVSYPLCTSHLLGTDANH